MQVRASSGSGGTVPRVTALLIDIDEVCFPFAHAYHDWLERNGYTGLRWEGLHRYDLDAALGRDDHDVLAEQFLNDPETLHVPAIPAAVAALEELRTRGFEVILASARFAIAEGAATRAWVARQLPGFERRVFLTREHHQGERIPKGQLAWAAGAVALIDDADEHHHHIPDGCAGLLMPRIGGLPSDALSPGSKATPVAGWHEVLDRLGHPSSHRRP